MKISINPPGLDVSLNIELVRKAVQSEVTNNAVIKLFSYYCNDIKCENHIKKLQYFLI